MGHLTTTLLQIYRCVFFFERIFSQMWFFVQLCSSWQDFNWLKASRGPSVIAALYLFSFFSCAPWNCPVERWTLPSCDVWWTGTAVTASRYDSRPSLSGIDTCRACAYYLPLLTCRTISEVARWCNGKAFGLAISRSRVQILLEATLRNNLRQVVYTYVPLSPCSITWYRPKGGDALRLGR